MSEIGPSPKNDLTDADRLEPIHVYGAGSWGTTLAIHLARKKHRVVLWDRDTPHARSLHQDRVNRKYLPDFRLPSSVEVVYEEAVPACTSRVALLVVPSHGLGWLMERLPVERAPLWVIATKGLEEKTCRTMSQVVHDVRGVETSVVLAGPSLAREVADEKPAAILAASHDQEAAKRVQRLFATDRFRVYTSDDPLGVELATALKNVVALAAGIVDGLQLGQNARGALLTRGLAEIRRLGEALGARPETFLGLAGVGDMVTTCTSPLSRNHTLGEALGRGESRDVAESRIGQVVEGVRTTRAACELARRTGVELPIAEQIRRILDEGVSPAAALQELMTRPLRAE